MRKRKAIAVTLLATFLAAGLLVFLVTRDSGPPPKVYGNLSIRDVAEIRAAVRRQLWREVLPNFKMESLKAFPRQLQRALTTRVKDIYEGGPTAEGNREAYAIFASAPNVAPQGYVLTNDASGRRWHYAYFYVVAD